MLVVEGEGGNETGGGAAGELEGGLRSLTPSLFLLLRLRPPSLLMDGSDDEFDLQKRGPPLIRAPA